MPKYLVNQNFWSLLADYRAAFITINRFVKRDGKAVMGAGIARQARNRYPGIDINLGYMLKHYPTKYLYYLKKDMDTFTELGGFVVKQHWMHDADLNLITASCKELATYANKFPEDNILLNFPGIGNGRRTVAEVQPILDLYLPSNVHVVRMQHESFIQEKQISKENTEIQQTKDVHSDKRTDQVLQHEGLSVLKQRLDEVPETCEFPSQYVPLGEYE